MAPDVIITSESSDKKTPGIAALIPVMLQEFEISGFSDRSSLQFRELPAVDEISNLRQQLQQRE